MSDGPGPEMYVGYLAVPPGYKRFLRIAVPAMLWIVVLAALVVARSQRGPGLAVWESTPLALTGTLSVNPYPVLFPDDGEPVILVEMGKHGSAERTGAFDLQRIRVSGWPLHRDGRRILELDPGPEGIRAEAGTTRPPPSPRALGRVTLRGEIVDSKCFLGAMKPGEGKTHKECATLCISGGIPPMLVARDASGAAAYYVLLDSRGAPLNPSVYPLIADPVEVTGSLEAVGSLLRIVVSPGDVRRL